jgi:hypothetical protein
VGTELDECWKRRFFGLTRNLVQNLETSSAPKSLHLFQFHFLLPLLHLLDFLKILRVPESRPNFPLLFCLLGLPFSCRDLPIIHFVIQFVYSLVAFRQRFCLLHLFLLLGLEFLSRHCKCIRQLYISFSKRVVNITYPALDTRQCRVALVQPSKPNRVASWQTTIVAKKLPYRKFRFYRFLCVLRDSNQEKSWRVYFIK